ncbi:TRAM domain-containing protein [Haloquadratum walsbyi]|uniref:Putative RNA-binding protein, contains TRAM domain protein n=1 Tax=Haloquadratum walsbyi J07HQW2 TaxID=1238425 RepID=U1PNG7_9EURY|nr:TRAM domain-containing protein [Haloquadratum walsbyi]ERG95287.1 MAG: putative RNA-binding protein, contains TRAM domain protein [Haloquadratum walsbyi J07HQW2]
MDIEGQLECLFSAEVQESDGQSVIEIPTNEISLGDIDTETTYQVALLSESLTETDQSKTTTTGYADSTTSESDIAIQSDSPAGEDVSISSSTAQSSISSPTETNPDSAPDTETDRPDPPVDEGEQRIVTIEDTGDYGDGLTRVERGFVVIVPDATEGDRVAIEITSVKETVAFADVVERFEETN